MHDGINVHALWEKMFMQLEPFSALALKLITNFLNFT